MGYKILNTIKSPDDVKKLNSDELNVLCNEIRNCITETVSNNGGHLASNLGAVELTVALHRVFNSPTDSILFDVGHQSYTHKLLTGRFDDFSTLRKKGGISGYMKPSESVHDPFITGHSSNSISAAYGIYKAKSLKGEDGTAIAVIGDGALTGGMAFEALNNSGNGRSNFIVVLNDNKMSISRNVGALSRYLNVIRSTVGYYNLKKCLKRAVIHIPFIGKRLYSNIYRSKIMLKNALYDSNIFESLGFTYYGPVDGHNISKMETIMQVAKNQNRPALIHVITQKGKGYSYAENSPKIYHGVSAFDIDNGAPVSKDDTYSSIASKAIFNLAKEDETVCAVTAAMAEGTCLNTFAEQYKNRFFDVGIAEQHAVTFCGGLASKGMKPYFCVYSSFLQRGYDQIIHDVAIGKFPVKFCIDRAGFVGDDGETHQGLFDVAFLTAIPKINIYSPASFHELENTIYDTSSDGKITAIRYPRGKENGNSVFKYTAKDYDVFFENNNSKLAVSYGRISSNVYTAAKNSENVTFIKLNKIHPLSENFFGEISKYDEIFFFEEALKKGGIGETVFSKLLEIGYKGKVSLTAVNDKFIGQSTVDEALKDNGFDIESIENKLRG